MLWRIRVITITIFVLSLFFSRWSLTPKLEIFPLLFLIKALSFCLQVYFCVYFYFFGLLFRHSWRKILLNYRLNFLLLSLRILEWKWVILMLLTLCEKESIVWLANLLFERSFNRDALKQTMTKVWKFASEVVIHIVGDSFLSLNFLWRILLHEFGRANYGLLIGNCSIWGFLIV